MIASRSSVHTLPQLWPIPAIVRFWPTAGTPGRSARTASFIFRPSEGHPTPPSTRPGQIQPRPAGVLSAPPPGPDSGSPPNALAAPRSTTFSSGCGSTSLSRERDSPARRWVTGWWIAWVGLSSTAHRPSESRIQRVRRGPVETMASLVQGTSGRCHDTPDLVQNVGSLFHVVNLVVPFPRASSPSEHSEFPFVSATNALLAGFVQRAKRAAPRRGRFRTGGGDEARRPRYGREHSIHRPVVSVKLLPAVFPALFPAGLPAMEETTPNT